MSVVGAQGYGLGGSVLNLPFFPLFLSSLLYGHSQDILLSLCPFRFRVSPFLPIYPYFLSAPLHVPRFINRQSLSPPSVNLFPLFCLFFSIEF